LLPSKASREGDADADSKETEQFNQSICMKSKSQKDLLLQQNFPESSALLDVQLDLWWIISTFIS
jgi:hypothetical protein